MSGQPAQFSLPFSHYATLGYDPCPTTGKVPAYGTGWYTRQYTLEEYATLDKGDCNVGLRCSNIVAFDIDVDQKALADKIERTVRKSLGLPKSTPVRIGRAPKRLLVARVNAPVKGWDLMHRPEGGKGSTLFQLLGEGKQFVIHGIHPDTHKPYTLSAPLPKYEALTLVTEEQLSALRLELGLLLIDAGYSITGTTGGHAVATGKFSSIARWRSEDELRRVVLALKAIPPDVARGEWFKVACSLHDGTHGEEDGFEMFHAWSSGELSGARPANYKGQKDCWQVWRTLKPGKGISTGTLFAMAKECSERPARLIAPPVVHTASSPDEPATEGTPAEDFFNYRSVLSGSYPDWLVEELFARRQVGAIFGEPYAGKSTLAFSITMALAGGADVLGDLDQWEGDVGAVYFALEGNLRTRTEPFERERLLASEPRIRFERSLELDMDDQSGFVRVGALVARAKELDPRTALVVIDTLARASGVDENTADMGKIAEFLRQIAEENNVCIILVHHSGKDQSKGLRGHSSFFAALDFAIEVNVERDGENKVQRRTFTVTKQREGEGNLTREFEIKGVELGRHPKRPDKRVSGPLAIVKGGEAKKAKLRTEMPTSKNQKSVLLCLRTLIGKPSRHPDAKLTERGWGVPTDTLLDLAVTKLPKPEGHDRRRERAKEALTGLGQGNWIWYVEGEPQFVVDAKYVEESP